MRYYYILFLIGSFGGSVLAQIQISGKVIDQATTEPLISANIIVPGTATGTTTDIDGNFELILSGTSIEVSYVGYKKQIIENLTNGQFLQIALEEDATLFAHHPIIIASATPVELNTPAPLMKIPRRHLERDNEVAITASLNRIPGVYMQSGALNTNRITIRGIGNRSLFSTAKIRAYLDEIPLTSGIGETTIEDIDLSLIESVEVWKGPTASTYGAGLGGMVKLNSINTRQDKLQKAFRLSSTFGSYGLLRNVGNFQYVNPNQTMVLNLNYNQTESDGYRENNRYERESFSLFGKVQTGAKNSITLISNYTQLKAFIPSSLNRDDYDNAPAKAAFTWARVMGFEDSDKALFGVSNECKIIEQRRGFSLSNSSSLFTAYRHAYELRPFNILRENSVAVGGRTKFSAEKNFSGDQSLEVEIGAELFREAYDWKLFDTDQRDSLIGDNMEIRRYYNLFFEARQRFSSRLMLIAGVNFNNTGYDYRDLYVPDGVDLSGEYSFEPILSPRFGLSFFPIPRLMLFATVSHGFSPPTLEETLTPEGTINPEIQPEVGWNFEIGSRGRYLGQRLTYEFTLYSMQISDLLVARRTAADEFIGVNAGKTVHNGLEAFVQYQLAKYPDNLDIYLGYQFADYLFKEFIDGDSDFSGNALTGQAPHNLSAGIDYHPFRDGFYANLNFQFVDNFPMRDDNSVYSDAYSVVNLKTGYKKTFAENWELDVNAGINNLLDEKYASMIQINAGSFGGALPRYYYPGLPRNYFGGVRVRYKF